MRQEARPLPPGIDVKVPLPYEEILARFTARLRANAQINQRSGVSVRFSIGNLETTRASALRRAARLGEDLAVPRIVDLWAVLPASIGRIEFDTLDEGREPELLARALKAAIVDVWRARLGDVDLTGLVEPFEQGAELEVDDLTPAGELLAALDRRARSALQSALPHLDLPDESPASLASALELCLEGLYLEGLISKHESDAGAWRFGGGG
jgi:magnesium chelatase subunit I